MSARSWWHYTVIRLRESFNILTLLMALSLPSDFWLSLCLSSPSLLLSHSSRAFSPLSPLTPSLTSPIFSHPHWPEDKELLLSSDTTPPPTIALQARINFTLSSWESALIGKVCCCVLSTFIVPFPMPLSLCWWNSACFIASAKADTMLSGPISL